MSILQPNSHTAAALNKMMAQAAKPPVELTETQKQFRQAMSHLAAAVNIVTTDGEAGRAGFTASAVCSVTDTPPTLLVCMNKSSRSYINFVENKVLCVNVLSADRAHLSNALHLQNSVLNNDLNRVNGLN